MKFIEKVTIFAGKLQSNPYVSSITGALMSLMPVTIIGGIGSLLNGFPLPAYQDFLVNSGLKVITGIPTEITTNLLSLYAVFLIAVKFCETQKVDGMSAGLLSMMSFLIVTPFTIGETGAMQALPTQWFGAGGLFTAFIVALVTGKIYTIFVKKGWTIKMPDSVPPTVSKSFSGLIPGFVIAIIFLAVRGLLAATPFGDLHTMIFGLIAAPLTKLGGTFPAMIIAILLISILWVFGIHGAMIVLSVFMAVWTPLGNENLNAYNLGLPIPNIISMALVMQGIAMGSGNTLGLAIAMLFGKSEQYRTLGKLAIVPNACGINEPIVFGTPIVMNFTLAIPFILTPLITVIIGYFGMKTGILPMLPGLSAPLGTPIIVSGLIAGGWKWGVYQALMIVLSYVMYKPFFNVIDKKAYAQEQGLVTEEQ